MLFRLEPQAIVMLVPVLLFSLTVHEFAHAFTAYKLGDHTAARQGRLTLNPLAHLDPMGTLLLFFVGFGYAKPVPVDLRNLKHPRRDDSIIAAAGPLSNLAMAIAFGLALRLGGSSLFMFGLRNPEYVPHVSVFGDVLIEATKINFALCILNILPIYPLDGSHIVENSLPLQKSMKFRETARYSLVFFLLIILVPGVSALIFSPAIYLTKLVIFGGVSG